MYTIVTASQKGGSGKTTLSGHLAVAACQAGAGEIALIDTDPQGSLAAWWNVRQAPTPHFVKAAMADLEEVLTGLHQAGIKIAVIDTPPAITNPYPRSYRMPTWCWCPPGPVRTTCGRWVRRWTLPSVTASL